MTLKGMLFGDSASAGCGLVCQFFSSFFCRIPSLGLRLARCPFPHPLEVGLVLVHQGFSPLSGGIGSSSSLLGVEKKDKERWAVVLVDVAR